MGDYSVIVEVDPALPTGPTKTWNTWLTATESAAATAAAQKGFSFDTRTRAVGIVYASGTAEVQTAFGRMVTLLTTVPSLATKAIVTLTWTIT